MSSEGSEKHNDEVAGRLREEIKPVPSGGRPRRFVRRYPLVTLAAVLALVMVAGSLAFAYKVDRTQKDGFTPNKVLPQQISMPSAAKTEYTAETIKQYDGKDGHKCYVAVSGKVYEIPQTGQWQEGQHLPSSGQAYCGADLTDALGKSPHGASKLTELPQVGVFK